MKNPYNQVVGKRIHEARKRRKISMKELGGRVNLHESTVSRYEKGDIKALDVDTLKEFAKALDVPASFLLGWEDRSPKNNKFEQFEELHLTDDEFAELFRYAKYITSQRKCEK